MQKCQRCHIQTEHIRVIWMSCFYDMDNLEIPFKKVHYEPVFYILEVCKKCRAEWLQQIKKWFDKDEK